MIKTALLTLKIRFFHDQRADGVRILYKEKLCFRIKKSRFEYIMKNIESLYVHRMVCRSGCGLLGRDTPRLPLTCPRTTEVVLS